MKLKEEKWREEKRLRTETQSMGTWGTVIEAKEWPQCWLGEELRECGIMATKKGEKLRRKDVDDCENAVVQWLSFFFQFLIIGF